MSSLRVGLLEMTSTEDVSKNVDQILVGLREAADLDLVCLPENSLFFRISRESPMRDFGLEDPAILKLQSFVDESGVALMVGSIPLKENEKRFNATVFLQPRTPPSVPYRKLHLFDVDVPGAPPVRESETFTAGDERSTIHFRDFKIGLSICYDLRFSELYWRYAQEEVDLILIPSAFLVPTGSAHWHTLVRARAIETQSYVIAAAQGGEHVSGSGRRETFGHSLAVDPWGEVLLELQNGARFGKVCLEKSAITSVRARIPMKSHRSGRPWEGK